MTYPPHTGTNLDYYDDLGGAFYFYPGDERRRGRAGCGETCFVLTVRIIVLSFCLWLLFHLL